MICIRFRPGEKGKFPERKRWIIKDKRNFYGYRSIDWLARPSAKAKSFRDYCLRLTLRACVFYRRLSANASLKYFTLCNVTFADFFGKIYLAHPAGRES